jgi:hypothetical protein
MADEDRTDEPFDPMPGMVAAVDQLKAVAPQQAEGMFAVYKSYLDAGFDEDQSFQVVMFFLGSTVFSEQDEWEEEEDE